MAEPEIKTKLPTQTIERWRAIVEKAARSGTDISQLVQHFAEQSFQNKVALLANQGVHRRALTDMRQVVHREVQKAERAAAGPLQPRTSLLMRPFQASRFDFRPPRPGLAQAQQAQNPRKVSIKEVPSSFAGEEHGCTIVPLKPPLTSPDQLKTYIASLVLQLEQIDRDIIEVDTILNQGVRNHQAVVDDLAATSRELYRLAMEFLEPPPSSAPQSMGDEATMTYAGESLEKPER